MNQKIRLVLAAAVVSIMVALVLVFGYREQHDLAPTTQPRWLPDLAARLARVDKIRLHSAASVATLVRDDDRWGVEERSGFPADFRKLQTLLDALATARLIERKTTQPEYFERLGLTDIERPDSEAVQVEVWIGPGEPLVRVLVGSSDGARGGRFVRAANDRQTWLIDTAPAPLADPADWIERKPLGVAFAQVAMVERELDDRSEFRATRSTSDEGVALVGESLPAGKVPRYLSVFDAAARSILTMEPEDVREASELDFSGAALTRITCFDGLVIEARVRKMSDGSWMTLTVRADESAARADAAHEPSGNTEVRQTSKQEGAREEAARLAERVDGWAFRVSDYVQGEATKSLADYIQDDRPAAVPAR